jgi:hypothetical protein
MRYQRRAQLILLASKCEDFGADELSRSNARGIMLGVQIEVFDAAEPS